MFLKNLSNLLTPIQYHEWVSSSSSRTNSVSFPWAEVTNLLRQSEMVTTLFTTQDDFGRAGQLTKWS